jgi:hypothetical protein
VPRNRLLALLIVCAVAPVVGQQPPAAQPKVKVNMLNVCSPSADEQKEIAAALAKVPKEPLFSTDFEVDRGRSSLDQSPTFLQSGASTRAASSDAPTATWVRIRHEFGVQALFSAVQYSFSQDSENMVETIVFHVREPKDLMELSIEASASSVTSPADMLKTNTPASHIKLERFGKASVALARCSGTADSPPPDQTAYQPLFSGASSVLENYRTVLDARRLIPAELALMNPPAKAANAGPATKIRKSSRPQK